MKVLSGLPKNMVVDMIQFTHLFSYTSAGIGGMTRSPSMGDLANNVKAFASNLRRDRSRSSSKIEARLMNDKVAGRIRLLRACNVGPSYVRQTINLLNDIRCSRAHCCMYLPTQGRPLENQGTLSLRALFVC